MITVPLQPLLETVTARSALESYCITTKWKTQKSKLKDIKDMLSTCLALQFTTAGMDLNAISASDAVQHAKF